MKGHARFRLTVLVVMSRTVENKEATSATSFGLHCKLFEKSFTNIRNKEGPKNLILLYVDNFSKNALKDKAVVF